MTEEELIADAKTMPLWQQHKFMVLVLGTILVSLGLVGVSLYLYNNSGAAQLDLSRPGYQSVRQQADRATDFDSFSSVGALDQSSMNKFRSLYNKQLQDVTAVDSFGGDVMSDKALSIDAQALQ